jgi:hypothetical protein
MFYDLVPSNPRRETMRIGKLVLVVAPAALLLLAGCGRTTEQRAATGGVGGVVVGALLGGPIGAVIGGAAGGLGGAALHEGVDQKARQALNSNSGSTTASGGGSTAPSSGPQPLTSQPAPAQPNQPGQ